MSEPTAPGTMIQCTCPRTGPCDSACPVCMVLEACAQGMFADPADDLYPQRYIDGRPTVDEAWSAVMEEVRAVAKRDRNEDQHFSFRGVDAVVNAMGPAMRNHAIKVIPYKVKVLGRTEYETKYGTRMVNCVTRVTWHIRGPRGDVIVGQSIGEAADAGDKAWSKAQSVAWRVFLIQAGALPTDDRDPDADAHERASAAVTEGRGAPASAARPAADDEMPQHIKDAIAAADEARGELLAATSPYGWDENKLVRRYWSDYKKNLRNTHDVEAIRKFRDELVAEAKAEGEKPAEPQETKDTEQQGDSE